MAGEDDIDEEATYFALSVADLDLRSEDTVTQNVRPSQTTFDAERTVVMHDAWGSPNAGGTTQALPPPTAPPAHLQPRAASFPVPYAPSAPLAPVPFPIAPRAASSPAFPPEPHPPTAPQATARETPQLSAATPPAVLADPVQQSTPALVVGFLVACAFLTALGIAALIYLKLQHRW